MKLIVLGATGGTGREIVRRALMYGHSVTAFVRSPALLKPFEGKIIVKGSLKIVEELFPAKHFLRVHKSYMVAGNKIKHTQSNKLVLINDETIPIGRSYKHLVGLS